MDERGGEAQIRWPAAVMLRPARPGCGGANNWSSWRAMSAILAPGRRLIGQPPGLQRASPVTKSIMAFLARPVRPNQKCVTSAAGCFTFA